MAKNGRACRATVEGKIKEAAHWYAITEDGSKSPTCAYGWAAGATKVTLAKMSEEGSAFPERSWTMEGDRGPSRSLVIWSRWRTGEAGGSCALMSGTSF